MFRLFLVIDNCFFKSSQASDVIKSDDGKLLVIPNLPDGPVFIMRLLVWESTEPAYYAFVENWNSAFLQSVRWSLIMC